MVLKDKLKETFGFNDFKGNQEEIIKSVLNKKDTLVVMATGSGKSLCYQLPSVIFKGVTIVVSPLISLMKDQIDKLNSIGINSTHIRGVQSEEMILYLQEKILNGYYKVIFISPETLNSQKNVEVLKQLDVSLVVIDEAHCVSEWGHEFRPDFLRISEVVSFYPKAPILALTATATKIVQGEIISIVGMKGAELFLSSFDRPNIKYSVVQKGRNPKSQLYNFLKTRRGDCGIVYCSTRKDVESISAFLVVNGFSALPYHSGLPIELKNINQKSFMNGSCKVIVSTTAFGMGIDKPNVRFIFHFSSPRTLSGYCQETGRSGRDGKPSECVMLFSKKDSLKILRISERAKVNNIEKVYQSLRDVVLFSGSNKCRRKILLEHFGQDYLKDNCGMCDNCL